MPFSSLALTDRGRKVIRLAEGWLLALVLPLGGAVAGYAFSEYRLGVIVTALVNEHQAEISRMQDTNAHIQSSTEKVLAALAARVQVAAQTADAAGQKAATAADQTAQAAETVKSAAAVVRRAHPVVVAPGPAQVIIAGPATTTAAASAVGVPQPDLKRAIEHTNRQIKGGH